MILPVLSVAGFQDTTARTNRFQVPVGEIAYSFRHSNIRTVANGNVHRDAAPFAEWNFDMWILPSGKEKRSNPFQLRY